MASWLPLEMDKPNFNTKQKFWDTTSRRNISNRSKLWNALMNVLQLSLQRDLICWLVLEVIFDIVKRLCNAKHIFVPRPK